MVKACLRGWGASKQSYSCLGSWVNRLGKFTGPDSILMQTWSTRPKAQWVGRYKWRDNHLQPSTDTNLVYSCLLVIHGAGPRRLRSLWTSHFPLQQRNIHDEVTEWHSLSHLNKYEIQLVSWKMLPIVLCEIWDVRVSIRLFVCNNSA